MVAAGTEMQGQFGLRGGFKTQLGRISKIGGDDKG